MENNVDKFDLDIDKLFPKDWYENVTNATNYVLSNMDIPEEKVNDVVLRIIDYNISKQLNEMLFEKVTDTLPHHLSFIDTPSTTLFYTFRNMLDACDVCPSFKEHEVYFEMASERDYKTLMFWKALFRKEYTRLKLTTRRSKELFYVKLVIRKK